MQAETAIRVSRRWRPTSRFFGCYTFRSHAIETCSFSLSHCLFLTKLTKRLSKHCSSLSTPILASGSSCHARHDPQPRSCPQAAATPSMTGHGDDHEPQQSPATPSMTGRVDDRAPRQSPALATSLRIAPSPPTHVVDVAIRLSVCPLCCMSTANARRRAASSTCVAINQSGTQNPKFLRATERTAAARFEADAA